MSQIVPDIETSFDSQEENYYWSIDEVPEAFASNDKYLSQMHTQIKKSKNKCLYQSMKFHIGSKVTGPPEVTSMIVSPEVTSLTGPPDVSFLPDLVPTQGLNCMPQLSSQEEPDQHVPDLSKSWVFPDDMKPILPNSDQRFYRYNPDNLVTYRIKRNNNNIPLEWRSTKLPSDKSEALRKALLCFSQRCHYKVCVEGKYLLNEMKKRINYLKVVDSDDRQILEYLLMHHKDCNEYFCIAPGCNQVEPSVNSLEELIQCINKDYHNDHKELQYSPNAEFFRFSSNCGMSCPRDVNETTMYSFSSPNSIRIYQNSKWAKVTVLGDIMQDILPLLKTIGKLSNHQNILPIDWLIDDQTIYYSSEHYAEPLRNKFDIINLNKKQIILQLIEAALYLNANKVAFLAWTCENVWWKNGIVRLTNFHMGSALFHNFDSGVIKCLLFPTIVPPELNSSNCPSIEKADVWGVCCLLYELLTHEVVHSHLHHMERDEVWRKLDKNGWRPECPFTDPQIQNIFKIGWEEKPNMRHDLNRLKCEILNYKNAFSNDFFIDIGNPH